MLNINCVSLQTIRKDIDGITKQHGEENVRLNQTIRKIQERVDDIFMRASDTKQMGREIMKNTENLLRETNRVGILTFSNCLRFKWCILRFAWKHKSFWGMLH